MKHSSISPKAALDGELRPCFHEVAEAAQPFVAALVARMAPSPRVWIVCSDVRSRKTSQPKSSHGSQKLDFCPNLTPPSATKCCRIRRLPPSDLRSWACSLKKKRVGPLVIHRTQWEQSVPSDLTFTDSVISFAKGDRVILLKAGEKLVDSGYERVTQVAIRGQFAIRGGIMDVFSWHASLPMRIEWDDEFVDSIRRFDPDSQMSIGEATSCEILPGNSDAKLVPLRRYLRGEDLVVDVEADEQTPAIRISADSGEDAKAFFPQPFGKFDAGDLVLDSARRERLFRQLEEWRIAGWLVALAVQEGVEGELERFRELATDEHFEVSAISFLQAPISRGFVFPAARLAVLSDAESSAAPRRCASNVSPTVVNACWLLVQPSISRSSNLGVYVVHLEHGIGRYDGLQKMSDDGEAEVLCLEYARGARLYVPLDQAWQVARYVGVGKRHLASDLGDGRWARAREKARRSIFDYATRMLRVQAERDTSPGFSFGPDTHWQQEFEDAFAFEETTDQLRAIAETKQDMESERPMDRLICGDVGFGKTEVAIRAVFKAVMGGKQAALMAPTTVLAQQHYQTLRERMSEYPITIELLSRYRTAAEQKRVLVGLANGSIDVVVATHRFGLGGCSLQSIGLLVVDERTIAE